MHLLTVAPVVSQHHHHHHHHHPKPPTPTGYEAWATSAFAVRVANCESGGGASDTSPTYDGNPHVDGAHEGKWQFSPSTYASVGGVGDAALATEQEQDYRAWLLWQRDGWSPWQCASMV